MPIKRLNTIRDRKDAERLSRLGYTFTEGDNVKNETIYPTLAAAQQFLKGYHGIIVQPECVSYGTWRFRIIREDWGSCKLSEPEISDENYVSHDYALLAGIRKALDSLTTQ